MTTFTPARLFTSIIAVTAAGLSGCSGGGGGSASLTEITPEAVTATVTEIAEVVANCSVVSGDAVSITSLASETTSLVGSVIAVTHRTVADSEATHSILTDIVGNCSAAPGVVSVTSDHADGTTTYELNFNYYCIDGPDGATIYNGIVNATENGTPSDSGPIISSLEMSADELAVQPGGASGETLLVSFDGENDYGTEFNSFTGPAAVPDSENPDVIEVSSIVVENTSRGETHRIDDLSMTRVGSITSASIAITGGSYTDPDGERVDILTEEGAPVTVNIVTGSFTAGTVVLEGASDTRVDISAGTGRTVAVAVNGELQESLDCDNADAALSDTADILNDNLPLY